MKNINLENILKTFIGFDELQQELILASKNGSKLYPPYNIEQLDDKTFVISLAIAGYNESDIDISLDNDRLTIDGSKPEDESKKYLHKGISSKSFKRIYQLGKHIEVAKASLENGILSIRLEKNIPEEELPKKIQIT